MPSISPCRPPPCCGGCGQRGQLADPHRCEERKLADWPSRPAGSPGARSRPWARLLRGVQGLTYLLSTSPGVKRYGEVTDRLSDQAASRISSASHRRSRPPALVGWRMDTDSSVVGSGKRTPAALPAASSSATAAGMVMCPANAGRTWGRSTWYRYWRGEVLQTTSGKPGLRPQLLLRHPERVHAVVREAREGEGPRDPRQLRGRAGGQAAQLEQLDCGRQPQLAPERLRRRLESQRVSSGMSSAIRLINPSLRGETTACSLPLPPGRHTLLLAAAEVKPGVTCKPGPRGAAEQVERWAGLRDHGTIRHPSPARPAPSGPSGNALGWICKARRTAPEPLIPGPPRLCPCEEPALAHRQREGVKASRESSAGACDVPPPGRIL